MMHCYKRGLQFIVSRQSLKANSFFDNSIPIQFPINSVSSNPIDAEIIFLRTKINSYAKKTLAKERSSIDPCICSARWQLFVCPAKAQYSRTMGR
jgi:hypothetical protein